LEVAFTIIDSNYGPLVLVARDGLLSRLDLLSPATGDAALFVREEFPNAVESKKPFKRTIDLLTRYFNGEKVDFDIPCDLTSMKAFTRRVLTEIRKIPYGKLTHYGSVAKGLGYANAARAVGQALKRNPIPIVIPCHRIIRGDGSLGGFDMGLDIKMMLLSLEGIPAGNLRDFMVFSQH